MTRLNPGHSYRLMVSTVGDVTRIDGVCTFVAKADGTGGCWAKLRVDLPLQGSHDSSLLDLTEEHPRAVAGGRLTPA
jgi:hypothetical protein